MRREAREIREAVYLSSQAFLPSVAGSAVVLLASGNVGRGAVVAALAVGGITSAFCYAIARVADHVQGRRDP